MIIYKVSLHLNARILVPFLGFISYIDLFVLADSPAAAGERAARFIEEKYKVGVSKFVITLSKNQDVEDYDALLK